MVSLCFTFAAAIQSSDEIVVINKNCCPSVYSSIVKFKISVFNLEMLNKCDLPALCCCELTFYFLSGDS